MKQAYAVMDDRNELAEVIAIFTKLTEAKEFFKTVNRPSYIATGTFETKGLRLRRTE